MRDAVRIPVTVKCRIGIDDQDSEADLERFVSSVADVGCRVFIVHARKAWLHGLSPKENREIPPLDYPRVRRLKSAHPELTIILNGGLVSVEDAKAQLEHVDGVMLGRAAYQTPWLLASIDETLFGEARAVASREEVLERLRPYVARHLQAGGRLNAVTRHILGLYHGRPKARAFRRYLSENAVGASATVDVLDQVIAAMRTVPEIRAGAAAGGLS
jgi:tRNA-dihydrouridine synthase A